MGPLWRKERDDGFAEEGEWAREWDRAKGPGLEPASGRQWASTEEATDTRHLEEPKQAEMKILALWSVEVQDLPGGNAEWDVFQPMLESAQEWDRESGHCSQWVLVQRLAPEDDPVRVQGWQGNEHREGKLPRLQEQMSVWGSALAADWLLHFLGLTRWEPEGACEDRNRDPRFPKDKSDAGGWR